MSMNMSMSKLRLCHCRPNMSDGYDRLGEDNWLTVFGAMPTSSLLMARRVAKLWSLQVPSLPSITLDMSWLIDIECFTNFPTRPLPSALHTQLVISLPATGLCNGVQIIQHLREAAPFLQHAQLLQFRAPREMQLAALRVILNQGNNSCFSEVRIAPDCFRRTCLAEEMQIIPLLSRLPNLRILWLQRSCVHFEEFSQLSRVTTLRLEGVLCEGGLLVLPHLLELNLSFNMDTLAATAAVAQALHGSLGSLTKLQVCQHSWAQPFDFDEEGQDGPMAEAWNTVLQEISHLSTLRALLFEAPTYFEGTAATLGALASLSGLTQLRTKTMGLAAAPAHIELSVLQDLQLITLSADTQLSIRTPRLSSLMFSANQESHVAITYVPNNIQSLTICELCDPAWFAGFPQLTRLCCRLKFPANAVFYGLEGIQEATLTMHQPTPGKLDGLACMSNLHHLEFLRSDLSGILAVHDGDLPPTVRLPKVHTVRLNKCHGVSAGVLGTILDCFPGILSLELCACDGVTMPECHDVAFNHTTSCVNISVKSSAYSLMLSPLDMVELDEEW